MSHEGENPQFFHDDGSLTPEGQRFYLPEPNTNEDSFLISGPTHRRTTFTDVLEHIQSFPGDMQEKWESLSQERKDAYMKAAWGISIVIPLLITGLDYAINHNNQRLAWEIALIVGLATSVFIFTHSSTPPENR